MPVHDQVHRDRGVRVRQRLGRAVLTCVSAAVLFEGCRWIKSGFTDTVGQPGPEPIVYAVSSRTGLRDLNALCRSSDRTLWAAGENGIVLISSNGIAWHESYIGQNNLLTLAPVPNGAVIALGLNGAAYRLAAGTAESRPLSLPSDESFFGSAADGATVCAVGTKGTVILSPDEGTTWVKSWCGENVVLRGAALFRSAQRIVVAGEAGRVFASDDSGGRWHRVNVPLAKQINGLCEGRDGRTVLAVASGGQAMVSHDAGEHWTLLPVEAHEDLVSAAFDATDQTWWIAGGNGYLRSSRDLQHWERTAVPTNRHLRAILAEGGHIWAGGTNGTIVARAAGDAHVVQGEPYRFSGIATTRRAGLIGFGFSGFLATTSDHGVTWNPKPPATDADITALVETNDAMWIAGTHGVIARSSDLEHWTAVPAFTTANLNALALSTDGRRIVTVGNDGLIATSNDAGGSWSREVEPRRRTLRTVLLAGDVAYVGGDGNALLKYDWPTGAITSVDHRTTMDAFLTIVGSPDRRSIWAVGENGAVVYTHDGGKTWTDISKSNNFSDNLTAAVFVAPLQTMFAVGANGATAVNRVGSTGWSFPYRDTRYSFTAIAAESDGSVDVLASNHVLLHVAVDGGLRWSPGEFQTGHAACAIGNGDEVWVAGANATVWHSKNLGETWQPVELGGAADLESITADADGMRLWTVGDSGMFAQSTDHGVHWTESSVGAGDDLYRIRRLADTLWITADNGHLFSRAVGGTVWQAPSAAVPVTVALHDIAGTPDGAHLWTVGDQGTILESTDAGQSWKVLPSGVTFNLSALVVDAGPARVIIVAGDSGNFLVSHDDGRHWMQHTLGGDAYRDLALLPRTRQLVAVGDAGRMAISDDLGETWYDASPEIYHDLFGVAPTVHRRFYVVGDHAAWRVYHGTSKRIELREARLQMDGRSGHAELTFSRADSVPNPTFALWAVRSVERDLGARRPLELKASPAAATIAGAKRFDFSLAALRPRAGEAVDFELAVTGKGYQRTFSLGEFTPIPAPWLNWAQVRKWATLPAILLALAVGFTVLLYTQPLWILALYHKAVVHDLLAESKLPGAGVAKILLKTTLLPFFAFHPRTLDAWARRHQPAFRDHWREKMPTGPTFSGGQAYVPLPVELTRSSGKSHVAEPSPAAFGSLFRRPVCVQILGIGGAGKSTLLAQIAAWLFDPGYAPQLSSITPLPVLVPPYDGSLLEHLRMRIELMTAGTVSNELLEHLIARGVLVFFFDAMGEWDPMAQARVRHDAEEAKLTRLVISSRTPIDCSWCERVVLAPVPLNSRTLLHFITVVLLGVDDVPAVKEMDVQFDLCRRVAASGNVAEGEVRLTPLLVRIYLDRAVDLLRRGRSLDELPSRATEIYLDYIRSLLSNHPSADRDEYLVAIKVLAILSLGNRFVPARMPYATATGVLLAANLKQPTRSLEALAAAGIVSLEDEGLTRSVRFVLDPLAEVCAAYAYAEQCGDDLDQWTKLGRDLMNAGPLAAGFRNCVNAVIAAYAAKGIYPAGATARLTAAPAATRVVTAGDPAVL